MSFASIPDETSEQAHLILPDNTPLESWGDAAPRPGVRSLVQPSLRPLFDTQALGDTLLAVGRALGRCGRRAASQPGASARVLEAAWSDTRLPGGAGARRRLRRRASRRRAARRGERRAARVQGAAVRGRRALPGRCPCPRRCLYDGRGANLSWLQETPDPVMKVAWQSWAEISHETAKALGVARGDVLAVETPLRARRAAGAAARRHSRRRDRDRDRPGTPRGAASLRTPPRAARARRAA